MKAIYKFSVVAAALVILAGVYVVVGVSEAEGQSGGAIVIHGGGCTVLDGDGGFVGGTASNGVSTPSGNAKLTCRGIGPNSTGKAVHWDFSNTGLLCVTPFGATEDWKTVVSKSGQITLQCRIKAGGGGGPVD